MLRYSDGYIYLIHYQSEAPGQLSIARPMSIVVEGTMTHTVVALVMSHAHGGTRTARARACRVYNVAYEPRAPARSRNDPYGRNRNANLGETDEKEKTKGEEEEDKGGVEARR